MSILRFVFGSFCAVLAGCASIDAPISEGAVPRLVSPIVASDPAAIDEAFPPSTVELDFLSYGKRLNGHIYLADGPGPHPTFVLLHGFPGNERNLDLAQGLRRNGFNVLFFHYRGAWGSEGEYSFTHVIEDVASATNMLRDRADELRVDPDKILLVGHSMGGFAALHGAARDETVQCVAGLAAANLGRRAALYENDPDAKVGFSAYSDNLQMLAGFNGKKGVAEINANAQAFSVPGLASKLSGKSVLLIAGEGDKVLPVETVHLPMVTAFEAEPGIALTAKVLPGDHSFSWTRIKLIDDVVDWAKTCR